jgi:hypothetical protein
MACRLHIIDDMGGRWAIEALEVARWRTTRPVPQSAKVDAAADLWP